jgi:hypothetical protein
MGTKLGLLPDAPEIEGGDEFGDPLIVTFFVSVAKS